MKAVHFPYILFFHVFLQLFGQVWAEVPGLKNSNQGKVRICIKGEDNWLLSSCFRSSETIEVSSRGEFIDAFTDIKNKWGGVDILYFSGHGSEYSWLISKEKKIRLSSRFMKKVGEDEGRGTVNNWGKLKVQICGTGKGCVGMINLWSLKPYFKKNGHIIGARSLYSPAYNTSRDFVDVMLTIEDKEERWSFQGLIDSETSLISVCKSRCVQIREEIEKKIEYWNKIKDITLKWGSDEKKAMIPRCRKKAYKLKNQSQFFSECGSYKESVSEKDSDAFLDENLDLQEAIKNHELNIKSFEKCVKKLL